MKHMHGEMEYTKEEAEAGPGGKAAAKPAQTAPSKKLGGMPISNEFENLNAVPGGAERAETPEVQEAIGTFGGVKKTRTFTSLTAHDKPKLPGGTGKEQ